MTENMTDKELADQVLQEVGTRLIGKEEVIKKVVCAILAGGHVLIEDIPGLGKTTLAMALAKTMNLHANRMQFTPDVLPSDVTGFSVYDEASGNMVFKPGAVFCNIFLADEINRTSPKSQSALLEVMEERRVTVDGVTRDLPQPFMVIATQNPSGAAGTQLLPDSEMDRFMIRLSIGYPEFTDEVNILKSKRTQEAEVQTIVSVEQLQAMMEKVSSVYVHDKIYQYVVALVAATRDHSSIAQGGSPRASIALVKMAAAWAFLEGRDFVVPKDVQNVFTEVMVHRIILNSAARMGRVTKEQVLQEVLNIVDTPTVVRK